MRSKKGALFHWIIFIVLAALGLVFVLTTEIEIKGLEGEWQLNFLENYYLEAEKDLLRIDQLAKYAAWQSALELGEQGGVIGESKCGKLEEYNLWSNAREWCWPEAEKNFLAMVGGKIAAYLPGRDYSKIKLEGKELAGEGEKNSITSQFYLVTTHYVKYTYDISFRVDLGLDVKKEYEEIQKEAIELMGSCGGKGDKLAECIKEKKKENWKFKECGEEYKGAGEKVFFCVESGGKVFDEKGSLVPVRYKFALDFTALESE